MECGSVLPRRMTATLIRELVVERQRSAEACHASAELAVAVRSACDRSRRLCEAARRGREARGGGGEQLGIADLLAATLDELDVLDALDQISRGTHPDADAAWRRMSARAAHDVSPTELHALADMLRALVRELHDEPSGGRARGGRFRPPLIRA